MHFIFRVNDIGCTPSATYMESTAAVPNVPTTDYHHLELLLHSHPNTKLISSVCCGLRSGFWPFANTEEPDNLPQGCITHPQGPLALGDEVLTFLKTQCNTEVTLSQYSPAFGPKLLPGMVAQPVFTVPKKGSTKLQLINDHSTGLKSLNSLIPMEGGFVVLDNLSDLGMNICAVMHENPGLRPKLLWKSDASQAYRHLPMHPHWQV